MKTSSFKYNQKPLTEKKLSEDYPYEPMAIYQHGLLVLTIPKPILQMARINREEKLRNTH